MEDLTFERLRRTNLSRVTKIHPGGLDSWSASDWLVALTGELGEAANIVKKLNRLRDGGTSHMRRRGKTPQTKAELIAELEEEIGDIQCYLDLFAAKFNISLELVTTAKFNRVSEEMGVGERL